MNLFGLGPLEILLILVVALILFGPKDLQKAGKTLGTFLNKLVRSEGWRAVTQTSRELRNLPNRLMRESGLEEIQAKTSKDIAGTGKKQTQAKPEVGSTQSTAIQDKRETISPQTSNNETNTQGKMDA